MTKQPLTADYAGPERRNRAMYVTANTEYHFRDGVCVAVRDRQSRSWLREPIRRQPDSNPAC